MSDSTVTPVETPAPRRDGPYGPIGLVVSSVAILLGAAVICLVAALVCFGVAALVFGWHDALVRFTHLDLTHGRDAGLAARFDIVLSVVMYAATSLSILLAAKLRGGRNWRALLGWHAWHPFRRTRLFWIALALTLAYSVVANIVVEKLYPPSKAWVTTPTGGAWIVLFVVLASVMAPVTEELLFRGWLYTSLRASFGMLVALLVSSVLFAAAHWEHTHLYALAVFPVGIALGLVRERFASIAASMSFHALYNGFAAALLFLET